MFSDLYMGEYGTVSPIEHYAKSLEKQKKRIINKSEIKKVESLSNAKNYLALVAIFSNDGRFLKEWIEFYLIQGVEHFYLYNHLSQDNFKEVLKP